MAKVAKILQSLPEHHVLRQTYQDLSPNPTLEELCYIIQDIENYLNENSD